MINFDYLYNPDAAKNSLDKNLFSDKNLGFQVIENGTILPYNPVVHGRSTRSCIVDSNGELVKDSCFIYGLGITYNPPQN